MFPCFRDSKHCYSFLIFLSIVFFVTFSYASTNIVWPIYQDVYQFSENGKVGLKDTNGNILLPCQFDSISFYFQDGLAPVEIDNKIGYINENWDMVLEPSYDEYIICDANENIVVFWREEEYGWYNLKTKEIYYAPYDMLHDCYEGLIVARKGELYGYIDQTGKTMIEFQWLFCSDFHEGMAYVIDEHGYTYINNYGEIVFNEHWDDAASFFNGYAPVCVDGKWGVINCEGELVAACLWDNIFPMRNEKFIVELNGLFGMIDSTGTILFSPQWDAVYRDYGNEKPDIFWIRKNGLFGYITTEGNLLSEPKWEDASEYQNGYAYVSDSEGIFYLLNSNGTILWSTEWIICSINEGYILAKKPGAGYGFLDFNGNVVISPIYQYSDGFQNGLAVVMKNGKWGAIDFEGNIVVPICFDYISTFENGIALVELDDQYGYVTEQGQIISGIAPEIISNFAD